jgi:hypothetical protein
VVALCATLRDDDDSTHRRAARGIGVMLAAERGDQLQAQTVGTLLTYAAARLAEEGRPPPESDDEARRVLMDTTYRLLTPGALLGGDLPVKQLAGELRLRAARLPTAQAVRADLASAAGVWHEAYV